ncbi:heterokaryon incompatibility protein-domain-containing protein [Nemania sp. FL0031]|nr:heterokaryon incompatibility protein-domain-containing protein [Nemania sp. FL0031]
MPYCTRCDRQFQSEGALNQHIRASSFHYFCARCQRDFGSSRAKQQHIMDSPNHHVCFECVPERDFSAQGSLEKHRVDAHNLCTKCRLVFQTPGWLRQHKVLVHQVCGGCRRYFDTSEELEHHSAFSCSPSSQVSGNAMADDLGDSLSTIRRHYQQPLVTLLLDIQKTEIQHLKSTEFIRALECLYPTQNNTFMRHRINAFEERDYVAISCTWSHPLPLKQPYGKYYVQSRNRGFSQSTVRDSVFERVRKYMVHFDLRYLWIDKECVVQEDGEEKETAIQAMDLVYYRSKHPIGLLYQPILSIADLQLLAGLMTEKFVTKSGSQFKLSPGLPFESVRKILELLDAIVSDIWWTRAWTYQENYRGSTRMRLLIPHCISSKDYPNYYIKLFGDVPGEIVLNSTEFHEAATAFCLAFDPPASLRKSRQLVLERASKYTLLLEKPGVYGQDLATRSMTPLIIEDIEKRQLEVPLDRLAIIANCCQYSARLDCRELMKRGHSVSLAILALFLLNGEILYNGLDSRDRVSDGHNITHFLSTQAFNQYSPPQQARGLTYNKSCRFIDAVLKRRGIRTQGHLWKLGRRIDTSEFSNRLPYVEDDGSLTRDERRNLMLLANELGKRGFRDLRVEIIAYLERTDTSQSGNSFAKEYQKYMAKELAAAVSQCRLLRLGALWSFSDEHSPYRGIFICNQPETDDGPDYVFTASREEEEADDGGDLLNDIDRHVSLEVDCTITNGPIPNLHTRRWIHGLCFFYGCPRMDVNFPWPRAITQV